MNSQIADELFAHLKLIEDTSNGDDTDTGTETFVHFTEDSSAHIELYRELVDEEYEPEDDLIDYHDERILEILEGLFVNRCEELELVSREYHQKGRKCGGDDLLFTWHKYQIKIGLCEGSRGIIDTLELTLTVSQLN